MQLSNLQYPFTKYTSVSQNTYRISRKKTKSLLLLEVVFYHSLCPLLVHGPSVVYLLGYHAGDLEKVGHKVS